MEQSLWLCMQSKRVKKYSMDLISELCNTGAVLLTSEL